jgi:multidrug resistance efflux pump
MTQSFNEEQESRSEIIIDIVDRVPRRFGWVILILVLSIIGLIFAFSWMIKYPEIISGNVTITSASSPIKIIAPASGRILRLPYKTTEVVKENDIVGLIESSADYSEILELEAYVKKINLTENALFGNQKVVPIWNHLGEVGNTYTRLVHSLMAYYNEKRNSSTPQQVDKIVTSNLFYQEMIDKTQQEIAITNEKLAFTLTEIQTDSILFAQKSVTQPEKQRTILSYLSLKERLLDLKKELDGYKQKISTGSKESQLITIDKTARELQLFTDAVNAVNATKNDIEIWKNKYLLISPYKGTLVYNSFLQVNDFVQAGRDLFTVLPEKQLPEAQIIIPSQGAGKISNNQKVFIKLENYPYREFGHIEGIVHNLSPVSNIAAQEGGTKAINYYLATISLPKGLKTSYGTEISFQYALKGTGDIITNDRRLISRIFENVKYTIAKSDTP